MLPSQPFNLDDEIRTIRETLPFIKPDEVVAVFNAIMDGYCPRCGGLNNVVCHCENDD